MATYDAWHAGLAGQVPEINEGDPGCGYFLIMRKGKNMPAGLAIYEDDDGLVAQIVEPDGEVVYETDHDQIWDLFSWGVRRPIAEETFRNRIETGRWSFLDETVQAAGIGDNSGLSEFDEKRENLAALIEAAGRYQTIRSDEDLTKAMSVAQSVAKLRNWFDAQRKVEKEPHLLAGKAVDEKYRGPITDASDTESSIKKAASAYETAKLRKRREEEAAAAAAAEKARREAEEAAKAAGGDAEPVPPPPPAEPPTPPPVQQIRTGLGRAATVRTKWVARVTDPDKVFARYRLDAGVIAALTTCAQRDVDAGIRNIDGVEAEEIADVRR